MTFISVVETFGAVVVALGGWETFKWVKRTWFPSKNEQTLDKSEADKAVVEVHQSVQNLETSFHNMWQENLKSMNEIDTERIEALRNAVKTVNEHNAGLIQQLADSQKEVARLNGIIADKTKRIREVEEAHLEDVKKYEQKITDLTKKQGILEKAVMYYQSWFCRREFGTGEENCLRRDPEQNPPLKYTPFEDGLEISLPCSGCKAKEIEYTEIEINQ